MTRKVRCSPVLALAVALGLVVTAAGAAQTTRQKAARTATAELGSAIQGRIACATAGSPACPVVTP
jgi:hypothetical protein